MKIAILTLAIGKPYQQAVEKGIENKRLYAQQHGYSFIYAKESLDRTRPAAWSKIRLIQKHLSNFDYLFWSDADSLFMQKEQRLEMLLNPSYDLILSCDPFGLNTGQFFIKNSPWSFSLLEKVYSRTDCINHYTWEQKALKKVLKQHPQLWEKILILPQRALNSFWPEFYAIIPHYIGDQYPQSGYHEGDFIIHCCSAKGDLALLQQEMQFYDASGLMIKKT